MFTSRRAKCRSLNGAALQVGFMFGENRAGAGEIAWGERSSCGCQGRLGPAPPARAVNALVVPCRVFLHVRTSDSRPRR
jgi:hypothetical protein